MLTEEQRLQRASGIGGSDVAAILGLSPYKTSVEVYREKVEGYSRPFTRQQLRRMDVGNVMEPKIVEWFEQENTEYECVIAEETIIHPEYPYFRANVDRLIKYKPMNKLFSVLECKYVHNDNKKEWGEELTDQIPTHVACQCAFYCAITNMDACYVAAYIDGGYRQYVYHRHEGREAKILEKLHDFWNNNVLKKVYPEPDTIDDYLFIYRQSPQQKLEASANVMKEINHMKELKQKISNLEKQYDISKELIIEKMGGCGEIHNDGKVIVTLNHRTRQMFDTKRAKEEEPLLYAKYLKEVEYLDLRVK